MPSQKAKAPWLDWARVGGLQDHVLGEEAGKRRHPRERQGADPHDRVSDRHHAPDAAHLAHVLLVGHGVDYRARGQEQERLEEGVSHQMEGRRAVGRDPGGEEHIAELRAGRIGDHPFDVGLHQAHGGGEEGGGGADVSDQLERHGSVFEHRREPNHQEHPRCYHGRGVDQRRHRGRALHGVGQPGVQHDLRRFAHGADEQQECI